MDESDPDFWKKATPIALYATQGLYAVGWSIDDLVNEARFGIWEASKSWTPEGGRSWGTYAYLFARRRVMDIVTSSRRKKNIFFTGQFDIENTEAKNIPDTSLISESYEDKLRFREIIDGIHLTELESSVLRLYLLDVSYKEIALKLNITYKNVDNAMQRVMRKCKEYIKKESLH